MHVKRTYWKESKLPANYISISTFPEIITNGAPLVVVADLNSTLTRVCTTLESDVTICTPCQWYILIWSSRLNNKQILCI